MERHHYAIFSARFAPEVGGVETFTSHLAHNLVDQGDQVTVVTSAISRPAGWEVLPDEVDLLRLPSHSLMGGRLPLVRPTRRFSRYIAELAG
ncbi:MAG: glycosyltransferase [Coriobacteriales bacterium]|nr:glycosyltransferase [Coriobacteriales bacterium]